MNVLYLTYGLPYPPQSGARIRDFHLLREIAAQHHVTCACLLEHPDEAQWIPALETFGIRAMGFPSERVTWRNRVRAVGEHVAAKRPLATFDFWNARVFEHVRALAAAETFDLVQIEHSFLIPYLDALPGNFRGKTILDLHNLGAQQYARLAQLPAAFTTRAQSWLKARLMQHWEARHAARFDRVLTVSENDAAWLRAHNPALRVNVIENGVDTDALPFLPQNGNASTLLFVGTLGYAPNADALEWFCAEMLPPLQCIVPNVVLQIVGRAPNARVRALTRYNNVSLCADVAEVRPFYENAAVVIVPLRAGGGTRLKILEAMAFGRVVISTPLGAEGIDARDGEHFVLAETPREFSARVLELLQARAERERITRNARQLVETRYSWSHIGAKLLSIYNELAG